MPVYEMKNVLLSLVLLVFDLIIISSKLTIGKIIRPIIVI